MITAGVDLGSDYTQAAVVADGEILGRGETRTGFDLDAARDRALESALADAGVEAGELAAVAATGGGRKSVEADHRVTAYRAIGLALEESWPSARTVLLMGAKNSAALKLGEGGTVLDFAENDKCAAGVGRFISDLTRFLEMDLEEMIDAALEADDAAQELNTQCAVFAESEVISLIHEGVPEARIARAVHEGIAERNASLLRRVGLEEELVVVGGVGRNVAFLRALEATVGTEARAPEHPAHVAAAGAAHSAAAGEEEGVGPAAEPGSRRGDRYRESIA